MASLDDIGQSQIQPGSPRNHLTNDYISEVKGNINEQATGKRGGTPGDQVNNGASKCNYFGIREWH